MTDDTPRFFSCFKRRDTYPFDNFAACGEASSFLCLTPVQTPPTFRCFRMPSKPAHPKNKHERPLSPSTARGKSPDNEQAAQNIVAGNARHGVVSDSGSKRVHGAEARAAEKRGVAARRQVNLIFVAALMKRGAPSAAREPSLSRYAFAECSFIVKLAGVVL